MSWFDFFRQHKLDESLAYQQFSANVGEEESWINEKNTLVGSDDYGDTLAAVQVRIHIPYSLDLTLLSNKRLCQSRECGVYSRIILHSGNNDSIFLKKRRSKRAGHKIF